MNIFTKLTVSIMFWGITLPIFSQQMISQQMLHKEYPKIDLPFYDGNAVRSSFLKQQTAFDTLWLPVSAHEIWDDGPVDLADRMIYEYHENGLLKKTTGYEYTGDVYGFGYYNNTYIDLLMDVPDTLFYKHLIFGQPPCRYYYNNHQADSSYFEEYYQLWDGEKWNTEEKTYIHLLDTATVSEFQDHIEVFDRNGKIKKGQKAFLTFDEQGNVIEAMVELYDVATNQYETSYKFVYLYDDNGKCHTSEQRLFTSGTWKLVARLKDIKWFEFHGFDNGDLLFFGKPLGLYYQYSPKNKNKMSSINLWVTPLSGGPMYLFTVDTVKWNIEPFSCHYFTYMGYNKCLSLHDWYEHDEHYHLTSDGRLSYDPYYCDTINHISTYIKNNYVNKYDERGRWYEYTVTQDALMDTLYHAKRTFIVDSFTYVVRPVGIEELPLSQPPLSIVPNPGNETVRITAADSIATITLYSSDGRMAYTQEGSGKEITVNLQGLSKGIYVVQARLKSGGVQTGKVVVR